MEPEDLEQIPFTLLIPDCPATFMEHKRCVVHIARRSAEAMEEFLGKGLPIDHDTVIAGAILADVGKLLEYEKVDGETRQSARGKSLRHPFTSYNWHGKGNYASMVDAVILGATEVDVNFNGNVNTHSDGMLMHGIGGWQNCLFSGCNILALPRREDLLDKVKSSDLPIKPIERIKEEVEALVGGSPEPPRLTDQPVAVIKWVDGTVIDTVWQVAE